MILCIFPKFLTNFVDWNVEKAQQGKKLLFSRLFEEFNAVCKVKMSQIDTENNLNPKIFQVSKILCIFFPFFDRLRQLER